MDAAYLKKNVGVALTEALAAMSVRNPVDKVEYTAKFLLEYSQRKKSKSTKDKDLAVTEDKAKVEQERDAAKEASREEKRTEEAIHAQKYPEFIDVLRSKSTDKQMAMDLTVNFITDFFGIPAAYIAVKKIANEKETLHYLSASKGQEFVIGRKLVKPTEEGDELPPRMGLSFDAFKIPEAPAEETPEEPDENAPPKPPPTAQPLIIDNVMRDRRIQFFSIPRLGAYAAIPLSYPSTEHDAVVTAGSGEEGAPPYNTNKINQELIIAVDTIGNYRSFKPAEIEKIKDIGAVLTSILERLDHAKIESQIQFLDAHKAYLPTLAEEVAKVAEAEAAALAKVAAELTVDAAADPPPEPAPETLKPFREAEEVLAVWTNLLAAGYVAAPLAAMKGHVLPAPQAVANLFFAVASLTNTQVSLRDVCGDITWESVRLALPQIISSIAAFKPTAAYAATKDTSIAAVKAFIDAGNIFDGAQYPAHLPVLATLATWLQKAVAAREAAVAYYKEVKQINLEAST